MASFDNHRVIIRKPMGPHIAYWSVLALVIASALSHYHWQGNRAEHWEQMTVPLAYLIFFYLSALALTWAFQTRWECTRQSIHRFWWEGARGKSYLVADMKAVVISKEQTRSHSSWQTAFAVQLATPKETFTVQRFRNYFSARRLAERIAIATRLELTDDSESTSITRTADSLQLNLSQKLRQTAGTIDPGVNPSPDRIGIDTMGEKTITLPAFGLPMRLFLPLLVSAIISIQFAALAGVHYIFFILVLAGVAFVSTKISQKITVANNRLCVTWVLKMTLWQKSMPLNSLEELFYVVQPGPIAALDQIRTQIQLYQAGLAAFIPPTPHRMIARSDRKVLRFGTGLSQAEADFIEKTLLHWVRTETRVGGALESYRRDPPKVS